MTWSRFFTPVRCVPMLLLVGVLRVSASGPEPIPEDELPAFLGPVPPDQFTWTVTRAVDFFIYSGEANPPLSGTVSFYIGGHPQDVPAGQTEIRSRLGRYRVRWQRNVLADGSVEQEAIVPMQHAVALKAHVSVRAPNEKELDKLLAAVGHLPTFSSGAIHHSFTEAERGAFEEKRAAHVIWIGWWAITLTAASDIARICRRRRISSAVRPLIFAGVLACSIGATIALLLVSSLFCDLMIKTDGTRLLAGAALVAAAAVLVAIGMFLARLFRRVVQLFRSAPPSIESAR